MDPDAHLHPLTLGFVRLTFLNIPIPSFLFPSFSEQKDNDKVASRENMACTERTDGGLCRTQSMVFYLVERLQSLH